MNNYNKFIIYFFLFFLPPVVLLSIIYVYFYRVEIDDINTRIQRNEVNFIKHKQQLILKDLSRLGSDALFLAELHEIKSWFNKDNVSDRHKIEQDLTNFIRYNTIYDQVRVIGLDGMEQMRVNWTDTGPQLVDLKDLQNKSQRYYYETGLTLKRGYCDISPMDLNIENGAIEVPFKPVLRVTAPVYDGDEKLLGIVVLNYQAQRIIEQVNNTTEESFGEFWIVNNEGYWLAHPDKNKLWGFQIPARQNYRIKSQYPEIDKYLTEATAHGQKKIGHSLISFKKINVQSGHVGATPSTAQNINPIKLTRFPQWTLITLVSHEKLALLHQAAFSGLLETYLLIAVIIAISAAFLVHRQFVRETYIETVKESETQFRNLLDAAPDAFVIVDQLGVIQIVNEQAERKFAYKRSELIGQNMEILIPDKSHKGMRGKYLEVAIKRPLAEGRELFGVRSNGSEFPVEISLSPLAAKDSFLVISIIRDITSRKKAEAARLNVEARYRYLVESLPVGVFRCVFTEQMQWQEINPEMMKLFALPDAAAFENYNIANFFCRESDWLKLKALIDTQNKVNGLEVRMRDANQNEFYASITAILYTDEENKTYLNGVIENISERKVQDEKIQQLNGSLKRRSIELETINNELESFSYSVSHDLRAPLRAMDGFSRTLLQEYAEIIDQRGQDRLNRIRNAAQRMGQLIDDLLDLSRVSRTEIKWQVVNISILAQEVLMELQNIHPEREVDIKIEPGIQFRCDKHLMQIVLNNLVGNAWKFTSKSDNATISVEMVKDSQDILVIQDNGAGFDMEYANKLFGAFQRLHDAHEYPGTGIGLATVQRIINKHGGKIWAESKVGEGAKFFIVLNQESEGDKNE